MDQVQAHGRPLQNVVSGPNDHKSPNATGLDTRSLAMTSARVSDVGLLQI